MTWYFNFCSPALPNDAILNANRRYQTACLATFMFVYIGILVYYKFYGNDEDEHENELRSSSILFLI